MDATTDNNRLPVLYEVISVFFVMPENANMWWETTIDLITTQDSQSIRAIAHVTFDCGKDTAGNYFAEEKGVMHFLHDNNAVLLSKDSSFQTGSETTWLHESDIQDDFITNINTKRAKYSRKCTAKKDNANNCDRDVGTKARTAIS